MNTPEQIPADVMEIAVAAVYAAQDAKLGDATIGSIIAATVIARAVLAERERCAQVAEGLDRRGREWVADSLWDNIKRDTAAAIRRGEP